MCLDNSPFLEYLLSQISHTYSLSGKPPLLLGTSWNMLHQARLLSKSGPTMRSGPKSALVLPLMLLQMTLGVIEMWTLITLEFGSRLMGSHLDFQTILVSSRELTLTTLQSRILHVLAPDVGPQCLCTAIYLLADGTGFVAFPDSAQDSWHIVKPIFFAGIHIQCS